MQLEQWQIKNNVSDAALAKLAKVSASYISHIKAGRRTPSLPVALRFEKITGGAVKARDLNNHIS